MNITIAMDDTCIASIAQIENITSGLSEIAVRFTDKDEMYQRIGEQAVRHRCFSSQTGRREKGSVLSHIGRMTGLSRAQTKRLVKRTGKQGRLTRITGTRHRFPLRYSREDAALLAETDNPRERLSGEATRRMMVREREICGKEKYENIARISVARLYRLRVAHPYRNESLTFEKTKSVSVPIGIRRKPAPDGKPGYLRVDSVHQGDRGKEKGVYRINLADEVTPWEIVTCVEGISEQFLLPAIEQALAAFPFRILGFHSDNGSEYINRIAAQLLGTLLITQTKSRSRQCGGNALVEGKNGSRIRKQMGHAHIPKRRAERVSVFYRGCFTPYLNFHRPCGFATLKIDRRGKEKKKYDTYLTPFEKLREIPEVEVFLKEGVAIASLTKEERRMSGNESAAHLQKAKELLFKTFRQC